MLTSEVGKVNNQMAEIWPRVICCGSCHLAFIFWCTSLRLNFQGGTKKKDKDFGNQIGILIKVQFAYTNVLARKDTDLLEFSLVSLSIILSVLVHSPLSYFMY